MENFCNGLNVLKTAPSISKKLFFIKKKNHIGSQMTDQTLNSNNLDYVPKLEHE